MNIIDRIRGMSFWMKLIISIIIDLIDLFFIFPVIGPILGIPLDVLGVGVAYLLNGPIGFIATWELFDPSGIDALFPTVTFTTIVAHVPFIRNLIGDLGVGRIGEGISEFRRIEGKKERLTNRIHRLAKKSTLTGEEKKSLRALLNQMQSLLESQMRLLKEGQQGRIELKAISFRLTKKIDEEIDLISQILEFDDENLLSSVQQLIAQIISTEHEEVDILRNIA